MDISRPEFAQTRRKKRIALALAGGVLLAAAAYAVWHMEPAAPTLERAAVWMDVVKRGGMTIEVRGPGTLVPN
jgi:HlyD family secretion protein